MIESSKVSLSNDIVLGGVEMGPSETAFNCNLHPYIYFILYEQGTHGFKPKK